MPSPRHELFVDIFRRDPALAAELLRDVLGVRLPAESLPTVAEANFSQLVPTEARTDLLITFDVASETAFVLIIEVQLRRDDKKRWTWPHYLASAAQRWRCPAALLVVTDNEATAAWAATPIVVGLGQMTLTPHVLGPSRVPRLATDQQAEERPLLAVLSALAHGGDADGVAIVKAAIAATMSLDDAVRAAYHDLVWSALGPDVRRAAEGQMGLENYKPRTEFVRLWEAKAAEARSLGRAEGEARGLAAGEARGLAAGEARGLAAAVLDVLRVRKVAVSEEQAQRVRFCSDLAALERWLAKAATAGSAAEVFDVE